jgi:hypothetical protein
MNSIVDIRAYVDPSTIPIMVFVDLQQEYIASPRALAIPTAADVLVNCRAVGPAVLHFSIKRRNSPSGSRGSSRREWI